MIKKFKINTKFLKKKGIILKLWTQEKLYQTIFNKNQLLIQFKTIL